MSVTALRTVDYEQAGELKIGQVGIANLRVRTLDVAQLVARNARTRRARAEAVRPRRGRSSISADWRRRPTSPPRARCSTALRDAGVLPVGLAYGTREIEQLAEQLGLPLLAKFRAQYERVGAAAAGAAAPPRAGESAAAEAAPAKAAKRLPPRRQPGHDADTPVRSGQQVYAENRDLTVLTTVGAGAEVIADGSIHIYGALRGRALAGAQGNDRRRASSAANSMPNWSPIAGHYKVLEDIPKELRGKAVQVWLGQRPTHDCAVTRWRRRDRMTTHPERTSRRYTIG